MALLSKKTSHPETQEIQKLTLSVYLRKSPEFVFLEKINLKIWTVSIYEYL